jgi:glycosyltransferase involved in cell wall biosynthesis
VPNASQDHLRVLAFGTYDAGRHPRIKVLIEGLRARGVQVLELNRPLGLSTADKVDMLRRPWRVAGLALRLMRCWSSLARASRPLRRSAERPDCVLVGYMGHFDVFLARLAFSRRRVILDHLIFAGDTATDRGAHGLRVQLLRALDNAATDSAQLVVVDTDEHLAMLKDRSRGVVVPVGAAKEWFVAADRVRPSHGQSLKVVFYGLFTPLHGSGTIAEALALAIPQAARAGRHIEATMVGTGQDLAAARSRLAGTTGVTWLDWVAPADLPSLVAAHDICLGIFSLTAKGGRVVPNKVYQGLAAGCVVVTADTPAQSRALGPCLRLVPPGNPQALADELCRLTDPSLLAEAKAAARGAWDAIKPVAVVQPLLDAVRRLPSGPGR